MTLVNSPLPPPSRPRAFALHSLRPPWFCCRVSPQETSEAPKTEAPSHGKGSPPPSATDPLEPWSTRGIKDMNAILAWKEPRPDSPWWPPPSACRASPRWIDLLVPLGLRFGSARHAYRFFQRLQICLWSCGVEPPRRLEPGPSAFL